jgi:hypothetical protein
MTSLERTHVGGRGLVPPPVAIVLLVLAPAGCAAT